MQSQQRFLLLSYFICDYLPILCAEGEQKGIGEKERELSKHTLQIVKVVERNGDRIEHLLVKADPMGERLCSRPECFVCSTTYKDKGKCRLTNLVYHVAGMDLRFNTGGKPPYLLMKEGLNTRRTSENLGVDIWRNT